MRDLCQALAGYSDISDMLLVIYYIVLFFFLKKTEYEKSGIALTNYHILNVELDKKKLIMQSHPNYALRLNRWQNKAPKDKWTLFGRVTT